MDAPMDTCTGCGGALAPGADWCLECLTPAGSPAPALAAADGVASSNGTTAAPSVATVAPPAPPASPVAPPAPPVAPPASPVAPPAPPSWQEAAKAAGWAPPSQAPAPPASTPPVPAAAPPAAPPWQRSAEPPSWTPPAAPAAPPPWAKSADPAAPADPWARSNGDDWSTTQGSVVTDPAGRTGAWVAPREGMKPDAAIGGTVAGILGLGFILQIAFSVMGEGNSEVADLVRKGALWIAGYYALVMWWVVGKSKAVGFLPTWSRGGPRYEGIVFGLVSGIVTCASVLMFFRSRYDSTLIEEGMRVQLGDLTFMSIALTVLIAVVAAPIVEELLFRGLLIEAIRPRSMKAAFLVSAFLFAIWHWRLHPFQILYYTIMGLLLAAVFWKWGLISSMACHFAFNGTLLLLTLVFLLGPGTTISADGATFDVPGGWDRASASEIAYLGQHFPGTRVAAKGPGGALVILARETEPLPGDWNADFLLMMLNQNLVDGEDVHFRRETMRPVEYPAGRAAYLEMEFTGREAWMVVFPKGQDLWSFTFITAGSNRAKGDFEDALKTLYLP